MYANVHEPEFQIKIIEANMLCWLALLTILWKTREKLGKIVLARKLPYNAINGDHGEEAQNPNDLQLAASTSSLLAW